MHFEHDVVLARVLDHFQAEIVVRPYLGRRVINLEGLDLLAEIGGVPRMWTISPTRNVPDLSRMVATDGWL